IGTVFGATEVALPEPGLHSNGRPRGSRCALHALRALRVRCHHVANPLRDCLAVPSLTGFALLRAEVGAAEEGVSVAKHVVHAAVEAATVKAAAPPGVHLVWPKVREQVVHVKEAVPEVEPESPGAALPVVGGRSSVLAVGVASEMTPAKRRPPASPLVVAVVLVRRKCVVEVAEEVVHVEVLEVRALASGPLREGLVPVGVVLLAFLFVAQHFVG
ncbi:unnamed protein product, partial [Ixodes pacificus]